MKCPEFPVGEPFRVQALEALSLLDSAPETDFDNLVELGRSLFRVPICLVSLVDKDRQWFKARVGLDATETPRDISFCGHAILDREVLVVLDATKDERFHDNPLVVGGPEIRFYAGAPISLPNGYNIGTVCIISPEVRESFTEVEARQLAGLAGVAVSAISVRAMRREMDRERSEKERLLRALESVEQPVALLGEDGGIRYVNAAFSAICLDYPMPGAPVFGLTSLTADDLDDSRFETSDSYATVLTSGAVKQNVTLHRDLDGFILVGWGAPNRHS